MQLTYDQVWQQREELLRQMQAIDRLRRGTLSQQFFQPRPDAPKRGPYYVLQGFFHGKKFARRVPAEQAAQVQADVDNHRRFQALAEQFVTLSEQLTDRPAQPPDRKKNSTRRWSPTSGSAKPTRS
jgi:hypothetical protein